jgi:hypothetical protein
MSYSAEISRSNPSCFLFLIDQSGSMADLYASVGKSKASALADVINRMLQQLVIKCAKGEGVRDYYHVGVIGYGADGFGSAFKNNLSTKILIPISEIADNPLRIEERKKKMPDDAGGLVDVSVKFPIWLDPESDGGTPMKGAFQEANNIIGGWLVQHPNCFPPIVIHITDGESTDGDPTVEMQRLTDMSSSYGNVILFNLHTHAKSTRAISFPGPEIDLPSKYANMLFNGASYLPDFMRNIAEQDYELQLSTSAKAFVLNGDIDLIITAIEIGTRPSLQLR